MRIHKFLKKDDAIMTVVIQKDLKDTTQADRTFCPLIRSTVVAGLHYTTTGLTVVIVVQLLD